MKKCAIPENRSERILQQNRKLQDKIDEFLLKTDFSSSKEEKVIKIPVVIHVIHNNLAGIIGGKDNGNISDEQIYSQIKVLNEDYRKLANTPGFNSSPVGADMMIEFFLRKQIQPVNQQQELIVYNSKKNLMFLTIIICFQIFPIGIPQNI